MSLLAEIRTHSEKKTWYSRQAATKRVQKLTVEYRENIKHIEPDNLVFLDEPGILLGLARTHARSQPGTKVTELMNPARMVNVDCSQSDDAALACALLDRLEPFWNCWQIAGDRSSVKFAVAVKSNLFELLADISD